MRSLLKKSSVLLVGCATIAAAATVALASPPPGEGENCAQPGDLCAEGLVCIENVCSQLPALPGLFQNCLQPGGQCATGLTCLENYCVEPMNQQDQPCGTNGECPALMMCSGDVCVPEFMCYQAPVVGTNDASRSCSQIQHVPNTSTWFSRDHGAFTTYDACDTWCGANAREYNANASVSVQNPFNPNF